MNLFKPYLDKKSNKIETIHKEQVESMHNIIIQQVRQNSEKQ